MFNLYEILRNAQGGHGLDNLATQFGITAEEADAGGQSRRAGFVSGVLEAGVRTACVRLFHWRIGEGQHLSAFTDPAAAQITAQEGGDILIQILASRNAREEIARALRARPASARTRWQECSLSSLQ